MGLSTWRGAKFKLRCDLSRGGVPLRPHLMPIGRSVLRPYLPLSASRRVSACADTSLIRKMAGWSAKADHRPQVQPLSSYGCFIL